MGRGFRLFLKKNTKTGFVNGCFDILHIGHKRLIEFARSKCDHLIIGIDSDERVKYLKGPNRPFNSAEIRSEMLLAFSSVDEVRIFDSEETLEKLIKDVGPDIMVIGSDYLDKRVVGAHHAKKLIYFERISGYSSSKIFEYSSNR